jgi:hypothetical protein
MAEKFEAQFVSGNTTNIVSIWSRLSTGNREHLSLWVKSGRALGLLDAETVQTNGGIDGGRLHVLVWVREAADAAYRVDANGCGWTVTDNLRGNELSRHETFEMALEAIRPVFSYAGIPPRKRAGTRVTQRSKSMLTALGT